MMMTMVNADEAVVDVADDGDVGPERTRGGGGMSVGGYRRAAVVCVTSRQRQRQRQQEHPVISKPSERIKTLAPAAPFGWREVVVLSVVTDRIEDLMEAIHEGPCFAFVCRVPGFQAFVSMDGFCLNLRFKA